MYQIDGVETPYEEVINKAMDCIFSGIPMYYAFHMGVDIIWITTLAPDWSHQIELTHRGLEANNKVVEPLIDPGQEEEKNKNFYSSYRKY